MMIETLAFMAEIITTDELIDQINEACNKYKQTNNSEQKEDAVHMVVLVSRLLVMQKIKERKEGGTIQMVQEINQLQEDLKTGQRINNPKVNG